MANTPNTHHLSEKAEKSRATLRAQLAEEFLRQQDQEKTKIALEQADSQGTLAVLRTKLSRGIAERITAAKRTFVKSDINALLQSTTTNSEFQTQYEARMGEVETTLKKIESKDEADNREKYTSIPNKKSLTSSELQALIAAREEVENNEDKRRKIAKAEGFSQYLADNKISLDPSFIQTLRPHLGTISHQKLVPIFQTITDLVRFSDLSVEKIHELYFDNKYPNNADKQKNATAILDAQLQMGKYEAEFASAYEMIHATTTGVKKKGNQWVATRDSAKNILVKGVVSNAKPLMFTGVTIATKILGGGLLYPLTLTVASGATFIAEKIMQSRDPKEVFTIAAKDLLSKRSSGISANTNSTYNAKLDELEKQLNAQKKLDKPQLLFEIFKTYPKEKIDDLKPLAQILHHVCEKLEKDGKRMTTDYLTFSSLHLAIKENQTNILIEKTKQDIVRNIHSDKNAKKTLLDFTLDKKLEDINMYKTEAEKTYLKQQHAIGGFDGIRKAMWTPEFGKRMLLSAGAGIGIAGTSWIFNKALNTVAYASDMVSSGIDTASHTAQNVTQTISNIPAQGSGLLHSAGQTLSGVGHSITSGITSGVHAVGNMAHGTIDTVNNVITATTHLVPEYQNFNYLANVHVADALSGTPRSIVDGTLKLAGNMLDLEMNIGKWLYIDTLWEKVIQGPTHYIIDGATSLLGETMTKGEDTLRWLWQEIYEDRLEPVMPELVELGAKIGASVGIIGGAHRYLYLKKSPAGDIAALGKGGADILKGLLSQVDKIRKSATNTVINPTTRSLSGKAIAIGLMPITLQVKALKSTGKGIASGWKGLLGLIKRNKKKPASNAVSTSTTQSISQPTQNQTPQNQNAQQTSFQPQGQPTQAQMLQALNQQAQQIQTLQQTINNMQNQGTITGNKKPNSQSGQQVNAQPAAAAHQAPTSPANAQPASAGGGTAPTPGTGTTP